MVGAMTVHNRSARAAGDDVESGAVLGAGLTSLWVGNLMLVVLNLPMIGMWVKLLQVPYRVRYPAILLFCAIGVYTIGNASFDVIQTEENLRRALLLSRGDPTVFVTRPISLGLLLAAVALLLIALPNYPQEARASVRGR